MIKLKYKLSIINLLSKALFTALFLVFMPLIIERINLRHIDNDLIQKREKVLELISEIGIEPFITSDSSDAFGSYNILKEEFVSLERITAGEDLNFIEVDERLIDEEEIEYRVLNYSFSIDDQTYLLEVGKSTSSILSTSKNTRQIMLLFLLFIVTATFITDLQYSRVILKPLDHITSKLKGISDPATFDKTPVRTNTSDFQKLDKAIRELMQNIDHLFRKEKDITVNISHELLTPVSVLRSKLENLLLRGDLEHEIEAKIEESLKTLHRLQSLINSLLLIARIESHQYLREDTFSIKDVLKEIINEINPVAEDAGVRIREELEVDIMLKKANRSLIFSMFYNIINNAVIHTRTSHEVTVKSHLLQDRYKITISDSGNGLTDEQLNNLFLRFKTRNKESGEGTGIGLAIAKSIADFHKIEISVSTEFKKGTNFSFIIPVNS